jgi:hypothetical protein
VAAFERLGVEPAMTLLPDIRVAGVITVLVSVRRGWCAVRTRASRHDGWVLLGFSAVLLLLVLGGAVGVVAAILPARRAVHLRVLDAIAAQWTAQPLRSLDPPIANT